MLKGLKASYIKYGITVNGEKIVSPRGVVVSPFLKPGNSKTGKSVYTYSNLPTNKTFETIYGAVKGTCPYNCAGCYATKGFYNFSNTKNALAVNTMLCYTELEFVEKAIRAQLDTLPGVDVRIHAAGDFFSKEYAEMWRGIVRDYPNNKFWTYTKAEYENIFDEFENANIVKSIIPGVGFNFGHIDYIFKAYTELVERGEKPYICRCTFDKSQHCEGCKGCINNKYVLFVEHSTEYVAENDEHFAAAREIVDKQTDASPEEIRAAITELLNK